MRSTYCVRLGLRCCVSYHHVSRFTFYVSRFALILLLGLAGMGADVGQEGHVACALQGDAQGALVAGAGAGLAARLYLGALGEVAAQARDILVVNRVYFVHAEGAHLAAWDVAVARAAWASAGATTWPSTRAATASTWARATITTAGARAATAAIAASATWAWATVATTATGAGAAVTSTPTAGG